MKKGWIGISSLFVERYPMMIEPIKPIGPRDKKRKPLSFPYGEKPTKTVVFLDRETGQMVVLCQPLRPVVQDDTKGKKLDVLI